MSSSIPEEIDEPIDLDTPPEEPSPEPEPEVPTEALFDLPDGRKVDAQTLQREWKENFMPDYTKKSQELAEFRRTTTPQKQEEVVPEWKRPDYVPKSYAELIEIAENRALERINEEKTRQEQSQKEILAAVENQLAEIKKADPAVDENALFVHANKYGFRDLVKAHENLKALNDAKLTVQQRTVKNLQSRKDTPVAGAPGSTPASTEGVYGNHQKYGSALEFLKAQQ